MLDAKVREKLDSRLARFTELDQLLSAPGGDQRVADYMRERGSLQKVMRLYQEYLALEKEIQDNQELAGDLSGDADIRELAAGEIPALTARTEELSLQLLDGLFGKKIEEESNAIVEIRAGTGGDEAALFAGDLYRMYRNFAESRDWKFEPMAMSPSEKGGFREVIVGVEGENAFRDLRLEAGGHRVQRVPVTETQGRIHTSAATVAVLREVEEYEVDIRPEELKIDIQASSGPGGQSVNTTNSSVRITHLPTGLTVFMQEEKSQRKNREKALRIIRSRVYELKKAEEDAKRASERREQTGSGDRSERVRTYNFPQDRCTDHRLGHNFSLADIIEGKLDKLVAELLEYGRQKELEG
ncbi:MAG: peptide chain release factor 1 [Planctomycetota bacterium]|jgi:peptide chain release factor 1|nr:peptide chain release factor 1 [Planctomycetota bacterium]